MVGEPSPLTSDIPPSADQVGNHHWPVVTNYFQGHGSSFVEHHRHSIYMEERPLLLKELHVGLDTGAMNPDHDKDADYHAPREEPGCRKITAFFE